MLHSLQSILLLLSFLLFYLATPCLAECNELPKYISHTIPSSKSCPSDAVINSSLDQLRSRVNEIINQEVQYLEKFTSAVPNCPGIGWKKVVSLNGTTCPSQLMSVTHGEIQTCERPTEDSCTSTTFSITPSTQYSELCGAARGYQIGAAGALNRYIHNITTIEGDYLDGISITHGSPRTHVWSFAVGSNAGQEFLCPCNASNNDSVQTQALPLQNHYFCDSGSGSVTEIGTKQFFTNPLWYDVDCSSEGCCRKSSSHFYRKLAVPTCNDLEVRFCHDISLGSGDTIAIDLLELYVR